MVGFHIEKTVCLEKQWVMVVFGPYIFYLFLSVLVCRLAISFSRLFEWQRS